MLGLKNNQNFQHYRLPRYSAEEIQDSSIEFQLKDKSNLLKAKALNYSRFGLAFTFPADLVDPSNNIDKIKLLRFRAYDHTFFEGPVEIRHSKLENGFIKMGVFTGSKAIDIEELLGSQIGNQIIEGKNGYSHIIKSVKISEEFQLLVAQYRDFLSSIKDALKETEKEISGFSEFEQEKIKLKILGSLDQHFRSNTDKYLIKVTDICSKLKEDELFVYKNYFQAHLQDLLLVAPLPRRSVEKPLGYSGDFEVMNMIYDRPYEGEDLFAKLQNRYWCSIPPARANIFRLNFFKNKIEELVTETLRYKDQVKITSLGSGPAKEIYEFIKTSPLSEHCVFTCVDQEPKALEYSQNKLTSIAKEMNRNVQLNFVLANVVSYLRSSPQKFMFEQDLLYASGLFDYLKQSVAKKLIEILFSLIGPKGELIIVNASTTNPGRIGMEFAGEWYLNYRIKEEMTDLVSGLEGYQKKDLFLDSERVYWYLSLKK